MISVHREASIHPSILDSAVTDRRTNRIIYPYALLIKILFERWLVVCTFLCVHIYKIKAQQDGLYGSTQKLRGCDMSTCECLPRFKIKFSHLRMNQRLRVDISDLCYKSLKPNFKSRASVCLLNPVWELGPES